MSDLISRADAIEAVENNSYGMGSRASVKAIKALPSAEAEPSLKAIKRQIDEHWYLDPPSAEAKGDLISRQDAVNTIKRYKHRLQGKGQTYGFLLEEFEHQIPSAEAVQGEWIDIDNYYRMATCSHCHKVTMFEKWGEYTKPYDFCPNCGATMMTKGGDSE